MRRQMVTNKLGVAAMNTEATDRMRAAGRLQYWPIRKILAGKQQEVVLR